MVFFKHVAHVKRYRLTDEAMSEVRETHGEWYANSIFAVYDECRAYTLYAPIGLEDGRDVFTAPPRSLFADMLEEC